MTVKGYQGVSIIDYPGRVATVLYLGGCNFRCPFCHNPSLVLEPDTLPDLPLNEVISLLEERAGFIDGVVIGGGEPLLDPILPTLLKAIKGVVPSVKIDTNASLPDKIEPLINKGLVDAWAVDIKTSPARYPIACGVKVDVEKVKAGLELIRRSGAPVEFRTTCLPDLVDSGDIEAIAWMIKGAERYVLQNFDPANALDPSFRKLTPYTPEEMYHLAETARQHVERIEIR
ncbi:anaerobic ribonucleoside-triphosphate reductase activating protein [candidate division KSB1 bacterium]